MRQNLRFYLLDTGTWLISLIPMPLLHGGSWIFSYALQYLLRYRYKVIDENLKNSLPEASPGELARYRRTFYLNFSDMIVETIKTRSAGKKFLLARCKVRNVQLLETLSDRDFILVCGHRGNWEWVGVSFDMLISHTTYTVYKPLHDQAFDRLMRNIRQRHGTVMVPMARILREMKSAHDNPGMFVFLADQSPPKNEIQRSLTFLHQQTPVYLGPEKLAVACNMPVVYFDALRTGRGRYLSHLELITLDPRKEKEGYIAERFHELLEEGIRKQPSNWLWSHRRWKYANRQAD
jgi:Kdo2-lipid IVA lauroyltransferase/acyltransferase